MALTRPSAGSDLVGYTSSILDLLSLLRSTQISSTDIPQSSGEGSLLLQLVLLMSCCGACPWAEQLCVLGLQGVRRRDVLGTILKGNLCG